MNESTRSVADLSNTVNPTADELARFWGKVNKNNANGCWIWEGSKQKGYGMFWFRGTNIRASRFSLYLQSGPFTQEKPYALHDCPDGDNPSCVNPDHLWRGTHADNCADKFAKGRGATGDKNGTHTHPERIARGDRNGARIHPEKWANGDKHWTKLRPEKLARGERVNTARLTASDVISIRERITNGEMKANLAREFGVPRCTIGDIHHRRTWAHI